MKHTIKFIIVLFSLVVTGATSVWGITEDDIIVNVLPNSSAGTVTVAVSGMNVTITATPATDYFIDANHIIAEKMVEPSVSHHAPGLSSSLPISGSNPFTFTIPDGYTGAYVTVNFYKKSEGFTQITSLSEITDMNGKYQLTADVSGVSSSLGEFKGTLDGGLHKIIGSSAPLFASTDGAIIRNIIFEDVNISSGDGDGDAGAVTSKAKGATRIYNCGILPTSVERDDKGKITGFYGSSVGGTGNVGGLVGTLSGTARVINCFSYANITGGTNVAGIVGNNNYASNMNDVKTMVVNCMFYGEITGGTIKPVYGGKHISNAGTTGINNYNYFLGSAAFNNETNFASAAAYYSTWPATEEYLNRFEYYRSILNSNRQLCTYWITDKNAASQTSDDVSLIAKWVLDPSIAPYPILKKWGKYPSVINQDKEYTYNPNTKQKVSRTNAPAYQGKKLGTLSVTVNAGSGHQGSGSTSKNLDCIVLDMDTLNFDYGYAKIQLPYYNEVFGNPEAADHANRYAGNYTDKAVTGWKITVVNGGTKGSFDGSSEKAWETGYNFADRKCTDKDLYSVSGRVFAQGGYYYVPEGVTAITIEAYWANKVVYLHNKEHSLDRVNVASGGTGGTEPGTGNPFSPAGTLPTTFQGQTVYTTLQDAIGQLTASASLTVYDQAIVLVGNVQVKNLNASVGHTGGAGNNKPFTIMSIDQDIDNEPDYCLEFQFRKDTTRPTIHPVRFDFLPIPELGLAIKTDSKAYAIGVMVPLGHFEITETAFMHTTQFEYDGANRNAEGPMILNGGQFEQIVIRYGTKNHTNYFLMGGHFRMGRFTPGYHATPDDKGTVRHCAVNAIGGDFPEFYLSGIYNPDKPVNADNPHCYINGGRFGTIAGAGYEQVNGNVTFQIDHAIIDEFYGGGMNSAKPVTGSIDVTINNSIVYDKYCGGPMVGEMTKTEGVRKTVTTNATNTIFGQYFGGGNGGTSYYREQAYDTDTSWPSDWKSSNFKFNTFNPLNTASISKKYDAAKGYHDMFEYEVFNQSNGVNDNVVARSFIRHAQFGTTITGTVTNNLTNCTISSNFYGGGNLGTVDGNVISTLDNTVIGGSAFGAGYSAAIPQFRRHDRDKVHIPARNKSGQIVEQGYLEYYQDGGKDVYYRWTNNDNNGTATTDAPTYYSEADKEWKCYTPVSLEGLGAVTGNVTLTINGNTVADENGKVMEVRESVYGGGEESVVNGNTTVTVTGGRIGTTGKGGATWGNVYGGGKGKEDNVTAGLVKGSTSVSISGSPTILHNVYGGGAFGSVGTFSYDASGFPTGWTTTDNKGKCTVSVTGGTIGTTGKDNGMVFGSSRGLEANPENPNVDKMAWVYDTDVTIGTQNAESNDDPWIKGSVYGGGENGHNFHNASVTVHSGTIGIVSGEKVTIGDIEYEGARYPNRGNVYGSGCGTDTYTGTDSKTYFDFNAGIVRGNTTVLIDGGHVVHNVYGGGAMGSVGTYTFDANGKPTSCAEGGTCTVTVSGGQIGVAGAKMAGYGKGGPDDFGHVFGAGRGEMHDPDQYPNVETCAFFNKAILNISGTAFLTGSAYGGSESGHVLGDTEVNISGGQIGCGKNATKPFSDAVWADDYTPTGESMDCASWPFESPFAPYDPFANETGDLDKYPNGESTDGGRLEASDGHTYYGNVFGGGSGSVPYFDTTDGISKYLSTAGSVEGKTTINITGGHIITNVYGGCEATNVKGSATITMTGGTVGVPRTVAQIVAHPNTGYIFGAGKGDQRIFFNKETNVDRTEVNIEGGRVYGSIFGGGEDGHVFQNAIVNIGKTGEDGPTIGTTGTSYVDGNVFGGGRGFGGEALTAGNIGGSIELNIKSGKILGSVYGGGRMGSVGYGLYLVDEEIIEDGQTIKPYGILRPNDKYDGSYPDPSTEPASTYYDKGRGYIVINITGGTIGNNYEYIYNPTDEQKAALPKTAFDYQNHLQYTKGGNVFTGGMGRLYALDNTTLLTLWPKLGKCKQTTLNMTGGTVKSSIYGGGEIGAVAQDATVNIKGGTVGTKVVDPEDATKYYYFGSVFGGGKGSVDNITYPSTTPEAEQIPISEAGTTGGNVQVNLNQGIAEDKPGGIVHQVFGCNDMNGSPKGAVTVHVYATQTTGKADIATKPDKDTETFDVEAVYGGGNLAAYEPTSQTGAAKVIIDGCGKTSIRQVYGGGNAASTPATDVEINGTYEILELFGGGNGFDKLPDGNPNPGANVGYKDYHLVEDDPAYATKDARANGEAFAPYRYGTGLATVNIKGGTIHRVFGGSNTKGNVRKSALTMLEEVSNGGNPICKFKVDEAYGGGKSAPMDAEAKLLMACIPGLDAVYGGAEAADVHGDVTLNITNGTFQRVFGGNNLSGTIGGAIKVNIEEVGCKPIVIGELYGGGNQAGYSIYGYDGVDANGKAILKENGSNPWADPEVNVISFTSIGEIYGGGFGADAVMVGSPKVNINEAVGTPDTYTGVNFDANKFNGRTFTIDEGEPTEHTVTCPAHEKGKMGAIGNVFGGGNAAQVKGNTQVNIGTAVGEITYEEVNVEVGTTVVTSYYIRTGAGTSESPYTYTDHPSVDAGTCDASGKAVTGQTYYRKVEIIGADIRGNVYGGGNNAEVTGNTDVNIGKKEGN